MSKHLQFYGIGTIVAACFALFTTWAVEHNVVQKKLGSLTREVGEMAYRIDSQSIRGVAMGAALSLGSISARLRQSAAGTSFRDDPQITELLRNVARVVRVQAAFVVNREGVITSHFDSAGLPLMSREISSRDYFKTALAGHANAYLAYGKISEKRNLYIAAPIMPSDDTGGTPIGVFVLRTEFTDLDTIMAGAEESLLLISPENRVFASNVANLLFKRVRTAGVPDRDDGYRMGNAAAGATSDAIEMVPRTPHGSRTAASGKLSMPM